MTPDRVRWWRYRSLLAVEVLLAALLPAGVALAPAGAPPAPPAVAGSPAPALGSPPSVAAPVGDADLTVMTRNLFVGTDVSGVFRATSWPELAAAGAASWAQLMASDVPTRAAVLADEVALARPDVLGLQEVTLWRDQTPSDVQTQPAPDATHVVLDILALLQRALEQRGVPYTAVATSTNVDVEFPRQDADGRLVDVRITDRDVLLVRTDVAPLFGDPATGHYSAQSSDPFLTGPVVSLRGWTSVDYRRDPATTVRLLETHLEVGGAPTQELQGQEFLSLVAASPYPVVAIGDFNTPPGGPTYQALTAVLHDAWTSARPADPGWTCCEAPSLADPARRELARVDLVLTSADWPVTSAQRTGDQPFRAAPPPLWASDHFGVTARVVVPTP